MRIPALLALALAPSVLVSGLEPRTPTTAIDDAFHLFWQATEPQEQTAVIAAVLATGASFEVIRERLAAGRPYSGEVKTGRVDLSHKTTDRTRHH